MQSNDESKSPNQEILLILGIMGAQIQYAKTQTTANRMQARRTHQRKETMMLQRRRNSKHEPKSPNQNPNTGTVPTLGMTMVEAAIRHITRRARRRNHQRRETRRREWKEQPFRPVASSVFFRSGICLKSFSWMRGLERSILVLWELHCCHS